MDKNVITDLKWIIYNKETDVKKNKDKVNTSF